VLRPLLVPGRWSHLLWSLEHQKAWQRHFDREWGEQLRQKKVGVQDGEALALARLLVWLE
jgi:hypothetical protein